MFITLPEDSIRRVAIDLKRITKIVDYGEGVADIYYNDGDIIRLRNIADWHGLIEKINEDLYGKKR